MFDNGDLDALQARARQIIQTFKQTDSALDSFFSKSAGYAVFPTVGEGALIIGGAHGRGLVYQKGRLIGEATLTKGTVGAQAGGQAFSEIVFFKTREKLQEFKAGNFVRKNSSRQIQRRQKKLRRRFWVRAGS